MSSKLVLFYGGLNYYASGASTAYVHASADIKVNSEVISRPKSNSNSAVQLQKLFNTVKKIGNEGKRQGRTPRLIKLLDAQMELERRFKGYKAAYEDVTDKDTP